MDWLVGLITITAMELIRRRHWQGWAVGLLGQTFWAALIYQRRLWGLAPLCLVLTIQYALGLRTWRRAPRIFGPLDEEAAT
jgi:hypothetical protein